MSLFSLLSQSVALVVFVTSLVGSGQAMPTSLVTRDIAPYALTVAKVPGYEPYSWYAAAAYCKQPGLKTWTCGEKCKKNAHFKVVDAGGDGAAVQYWFVGYDTKLQTVIVSHQGTDPTKIKALLTDADLRLKPLDPNIFPGIPNGVLVHNGFSGQHKITWPDIKKNVDIALKQSGLKTVTIVGHSLGGALALLDALAMPSAFANRGIKFRTITYGAPRVGNQAFVGEVNKKVPDLERITNQRDFVPIIPPQWKTLGGYVHAHGERHIINDAKKEWYICPGNDNPGKMCSTGHVKTVLLGNVLDHFGPYNGVNMGLCLK